MEDITREEIEEMVAELMRMGLIEIVGIDDKGEWLYAATESARQLLSEHMLGMEIDRIFNDD